jgi:hypothetical protein
VKRTSRALSAEEANERKTTKNEKTMNTTDLKLAATLAPQACTSRARSTKCKSLRMSPAWRMQWPERKSVN